MHVLPSVDYQPLSVRIMRRAVYFIRLTDSKLYLSGQLVGGNFPVKKNLP
jgi:hypothetical protein